MKFSLFLGIAAGILQLATYGLYSWHVSKGKSQPNATTWTVWAFLSVMSASSYTVMTDDFAKYFLLVVSGVANVATFFYALVAGKFMRIQRWDWLVLCLGILSGLVWWEYQSAAYANFIVVVADALAFFPMYRGLWSNPSLEYPLPWFLWTLAYALTVLVIALRWNGHYQDLVSPICMVFLHLAVGLLALRKTTETT